MTQAQNAFDERYFELYVNPFLHQLRLMMAKYARKGGSAIEIGCGTGELTSLLAAKSCRVVGVDPDEKHVAETRARLSEFSECKTEVLQTDFETLDQFEDKEFDTALLMMTVHELTWEKRQPVLQEAIRLSRKLIVADYIVPQPKDPHGAIARTAELLAGQDHFSNYQSFQKLGGMRALESALNIKPAKLELNTIGTAEVIVYHCK